MKTFGSILFIVGALLIFGVAWVMPWFTSPIWSSAHPSHFDGTVWELSGPIFMAMSLLTPAGIAMIAIGTVLIGKSGKSQIWLYSIALLIVIFSFLYPPTLNYYPTLFGVGGFLIVILFFGILWYWARDHRSQSNSGKIASMYQLASYIFFFLIAMLMCTMLGNPFSGLLFPEKVIEQNSLPFYYSFGTKALIYFVLAMFFTFLSLYRRAQNTKST
jgi:hypothetical protein